MNKIELAELDYVAGMKYKELAAKYKVSINTVKSWKTRNDWSREKVRKKDTVVCKKDSSVQKTEKKVCTQKKKVQDPQKELRHKIIKSVGSNDELSDRQKMFCIYYADCLNATQAYMNAFDAKRATAGVEACRMLKTPKVKAEIARLRQIKYEDLLLRGEDLVEKQIRIAFSNMSNFAEFGTELVPLFDNKGKPLLDENGEQKTYRRNYMYFKDSTEIDGFAISEIKNGKQGMSIKLEDRQKAMDWLTKYFQLNPADTHKKDFDNARLDIERQKLDVMKDRNKEPDKLLEPLIVRPIYGRGENSGE